MAWLWQPFVKLLTALATLSALSVAFGETSAAVTHSIEGKILWPDTVTSAARIKAVLNLNNGAKLYGWPRTDGGFVLNDVPEGTHMLAVDAIGLVYPEVRLEVNAAFPGKALVTLANDQSKILPPPLVLRPSSLAEYFEKREPFNAIGFLKTPYGLMAVFGIFAVFVLPKLRLDPEEEAKKD